MWSDSLFYFGLAGALLIAWFFFDLISEIIEDFHKAFNSEPYEPWEEDNET